jgi:hypothetical protein
MNIPKRLYPHLYEFEKLRAEGRELGANVYATKNERAFERECVEIFKIKRYRDKNLGTDKEIHGNGKEK